MSLAQKRFARELISKRIGGWTVRKVINAGKSAVVFRATKKSKEAAIKVFDPDLIDKFGKEVQAERVERERRLIGKNHPNLIKILDGGHDNNKDLFFVVMELFPGQNLAECLETVPPEKVRTILAQVASAAHFLEDLGLAHRDIKPSNIGLRDDASHAVLMDLGVIKPVGIANFTDIEGRRFVGTLQYASPEFLFRMEEDTPIGWRATTFYQLGAVLHDLITRQPIFSDYLEPFARMVEAVKEVTPTFDATGCDPDLVELARHCLVKQPQLRLELVTWEDLLLGTKVGSETQQLLKKIKQRTRRWNGTKQPGSTGQIIATPRFEAMKLRIQELAHQVAVSSPILPPSEILNAGEDPQVFCLRFLPSEKFGLPLHLLVAFRVTPRTSQIVKLESAAFGSAAILTGDSFQTAAYDKIYVGTLTSAKMAASIESFLYKAFNDAQQLDPEDGQQPHAVARSAVTSGRPT